MDTTLVRLPACAPEVLTSSCFGRAQLHSSVPLQSWAVGKTARALQDLPTEIFESLSLSLEPTIFRCGDRHLHRPAARKLNEGMALSEFRFGLWEPTPH